MSDTIRPPDDLGFAPEPAAPADPPMEPVGLGAGAPATQFIYPRNILASQEGVVVGPYMIRAASISADANGRKIVPEGTVLATHAASLMGPRVSAEVAQGVLMQRIDVTDGNQPASVLFFGHVREAMCWDNGVFGTVTSGAKTDLVGKITFHAFQF